MGRKLNLKMGLKMGRKLKMRGKERENSSVKHQGFRHQKAIQIMESSKYNVAKNTHQTAGGTT